MAAIYDQLDEVQQYGGLSSVHFHKMMHPVPSVPVVDRAKFLLERAKDNVILDIGCTGELSQAISKVAKDYYGIDSVENPGYKKYYRIDLEQVDPESGRLQRAAGHGKP